MAELLNLISLHSISGDRRQRQSNLSAKELQPESSESVRRFSLPSPVTYIHDSLDSLRGLAKATVIPRWLTADDSADRREDLWKLARLSKLKDELAQTTDPRHRRQLEKEIYPLQFDPVAEAERRAGLFDVERVKHRLQLLEDARDDDDLPRMVSLIRNQTSRGFGGMYNPQLYDRPGVRTEPVIDRYQKIVAQVLNRIVAACKNDDSRLDKHEVESDLEQTCGSFGRTALVCSGGGTMGMVHIGVIKALLEAKRLPRIVCGSSAGAIVCAILCTRTDLEMPAVLEQFAQGDLDVFVGRDESSLSRLLHMMQKRCLYNFENLKRVMQKYIGDLTFQEAHLRCGKILNITVSCVTGHDNGVKVMNYLTDPDVVIWSAVVASCALPGVFEPATLYAKVRKTKELQALPGLYVDGSIRGDIPIKQLAKELGCSYFIVAQANPHVLIYQQMRRQLGSGSIVNTAEKFCSLALDEYAELLPWSYLGQAGELAFAVMRQTYTGDVTITPDLTLHGFARVLCNPTKTFIDASIRMGQSLTSVYLPMIKNHLKIELALLKARNGVKEAIHFSNSRSDLRRAAIGRSKRSNSAQSMPSLLELASQHDRPATLRRAKTDDQFSDVHSHDAKLVTETEESDELDSNSMTSLTPPADGVDADSDIDMDEVWMAQSRSAPTSPLQSRSLLGSPIQSRSRSPAFTPIGLLMTAMTSVKETERTDGEDREDLQLASTTQPSVRGRKRSSSTGDVGLRS